MKEIKNWKDATVFDLESDGLLQEATIFHVLSFHMADGKSGSIDGKDHDRFKKFLNYHIENEIPVVAHRGILFDVALCEKLLNMDLSKLMVIDTLALSWYLNTKRKIHGLDSFLEDYGIAKPKVDGAAWVLPIRGLVTKLQNVGKGADKKKIVVYHYIKEPEGLELQEDYKTLGLVLNEVDKELLNSLETEEEHLKRLSDHKELMITRCEEDVKINLALWQDFMKRLHEMYTTTKHCVDNKMVNPKRMSDDEETYLDRYVDKSSVDEYIERCLTFLMFKMDCARLQEKTRWKADVQYLKDTEKELEDLISPAIKALESIMPPIPVYGNRKRPEEPLKKDGSLKVTAVKWNEALEGLGTKDCFGNEKVKLVEGDEDNLKVLNSYKDPNANSSDQLKALFFSHGWEPETFKFVKDEEAMEAWVKGGFKKEDKPVPRKIPQISKDGDDGKELCHSLIKLAEKVPEILKYNKYTMLKHRLDTIKGFLRNVSEDDHLMASIGGFTNTLRVQHREIVNLVGVDKEYGENIRGGLTCEEDEILLGSDLSSLEDRTKHHFMLPHDPEYVETMMADDYDPHILTAHSAGMVSDEELKGFKEGTLTGEVKERVSKARKGGKCTNYACVPSDISMVKTSKGWKWVEDIKEGDFVLGYDTKTDSTCETKVIKIERLLKSELYKVVIGDQTFYTTKEHAWVTKEGFTHSDDLVVGDLIFNGEQYEPFKDMYKLPQHKDTICLSTDKNTFMLKQGLCESLTGNCVYGGSPDAIAASAGIEKELAKKLHEGYWKLNWSVNAIAEEQCVIEDSRKQKWLINPINGLCYSLRTEKDRFSTLAQGSGSFFFDMWVDRILTVMEDKFKTKKLTGSFHK